MVPPPTNPPGTSTSRRSDRRPSARHPRPLTAPADASSSLRRYSRTAHLPISHAFSVPPTLACAPCVRPVHPKDAMSPTPRSTTLDHHRITVGGRPHDHRNHRHHRKLPAVAHPDLRDHLDHLRRVLFHPPGVLGRQTRHPRGPDSLDESVQGGTGQPRRGVSHCLRLRPIRLGRLVGSHRPASCYSADSSPRRSPPSSWDCFRRWCSSCR